MNKIVNIWRVHFLRVEFVISIVAAIAFAIWVTQLGGKQTIDVIIKGNRAAIYGALASVFGSLLGFAITAESIVLTVSGNEHLEIVRKSKHYVTLWKVFVSAIRALALATTLVLVALIFDRDATPSWYCLTLAAFGTILAAIRLVRCIWVLELIVDLISKPPQERQAGE